MKSKTTIFILLAMFTTLLSCKTKTSQQDPTEGPNIIYIMLDEWGYYEWSAMGHPILQTPVIDKIASEGMRFTQILAGGNVCAPTRSCLMTGLHGGHTPVRANGGGMPLPAEAVTIASILKEAGYATGGFGKWGLGDAGTTGVPEKHGFDIFFGYYHQIHAHTYYPEYLLRNSEKIFLDGNTGDFHEGKVFSQYLIHEEGLKFIRDNASKGTPFFAYLPWTPPHGQWGMPEDDPAWIKYRDMEWDAPNLKGDHDAQMYAAMVEMADRQIGDIMNLLIEMGIDRETIVFISGDNGGSLYFPNETHPHGFLGPNLDPKTGKRFRGGKRNFYEGGLRIPFMARWPGEIKPGQVSDHLGYFPDILPTLAELAGTEPGIETDGLSLVPTLLGEKAAGRKQETHDFLYWEDPESCAVRMGNWKAIRPAEGAPFELYDLNLDIEEQNDVADKYPDIIDRVVEISEKASTPARIGSVTDSTLAFDKIRHWKINKLRGY